MMCLGFLLANQALTQRPFWPDLKSSGSLNKLSSGGMNVSTKWKPQGLIHDQNVHHCEHGAQYFSIKVILPIKKNKENDTGSIENLTGWIRPF